MDSALLSAIIAFVGVVVSVAISFFSNKKLLKTELVKIEMQIEQNYATKLVDKRLEFYPLLYESISKIAKKIRRVLNEALNEKINLQEIKGFQDEYDLLNSKYAVVFSSVSSGNSYQLRLAIIEIIKACENEHADYEVSIELLKKLGDCISKLEFSLKQDLGIYIVEFQDAKRELSLADYDDVIKQREKKKNKE